MERLPEKLQKKLLERQGNNAFRTLGEPSGLIDFSSNDYLGFNANNAVFEEALKILEESGTKANGAGGSRLLTGNHSLYAPLEEKLCNFHSVDAALVFNSGYDANMGLLGAVPQRGDVVFYDEFVHASVRDGLQLSNAKSYKFKHNDLEDLVQGVERIRNVLAEEAEIYVVTEAVFSMDGDSPDLISLAKICKSRQIRLIVDEAHSIGVFGRCGEGLVQDLGMADAVFARVITFGKALGCHGAAVLGGSGLKDYLVNFARSLIYTTGLPPHSLASIAAVYGQIQLSNDVIESLREKITFFKDYLVKLGLQTSFVPSDSAIQCCKIKGNSAVKGLAKALGEKGFDVKPILSPTVPVGQERLRICIHEFNTEKEIRAVLTLLKKRILN